MSAVDYRFRARKALKGKWKVILPLILLAQLTLSYFGIDIVYQLFFSEPRVLYLGSHMPFNYIYYVPKGIGWLLIALMIALTLVGRTVIIGQYRIASAILADETPRVRQLFPLQLIFKALAMNLVRSLLVALQAMLLIIPGIIAIYRYSMADYLLMQHPEMGPVEVLRESRKRMMGHKMALFSLHLSFIGWLFLGFVVLLLPDYWSTYVRFPGAGLLSALLNLVFGVFLSTYILMAETLFFSDIYQGAGEAQPKADAPETDAPEADAQAGDAQNFNMPDASEMVARDIFVGHGCSRNRLREEGRLEDYEQLNPSGLGEERWKREYAGRLMQSFDQEPAVLDNLLALASEYAMDDLLSRTLERIDRHIRQQTLPEVDILNMCGQVLATLTSGAFAGNEGFIQRRKQQIADMADRLEQLLQQKQPDENWRQTLNYIREMCL